MMWEGKSKQKRYLLVIKAAEKWVVLHCNELFWDCETLVHEQSVTRNNKNYSLMPCCFFVHVKSYFGAGMEK